MLGAGVLLSACSPVQMGAAAIAGNQRISQSTLSADVADLNRTIAKFPPREVQLTSAQAPRAVLGLLVQSAIWDRVAKNAGISLTPAQVAQGKAAALTQFEQEAAQQVEQSGGTPSQSQLRQMGSVMALDYGVGPRMTDAYGRTAAQQIAMETKLNGGKPVASQAEYNKVIPKLTAALNQAVKELNIKVNPQYGKLDPAQGSIVAGPDTLSKQAAGSAAAGAGGVGSAAGGAAGGSS